ncbi:MAG: class I tRNA ligase family protein, partial [Chlamydiales bacterium]|nr:class I tRNA ligase family protein [Chlamydiales bacterium]
ITPFITEELFARLQEHFKGIKPSKNLDPYTTEAINALLAQACIKAPYPKQLAENDINPEAEKTFSYMQEIVRSVRNIRAEMQIPPSEKTSLFFIHRGNKTEVIKEHAAIIQALTPTQSIEFVEQEPSIFGATAIFEEIKLFIPMPESLKQKEKIRLEKEQEKCLKLIESTQAKLANQEFFSKAPQEIVQKMQQALSQTEKQLKEIQSKLSNLLYT